MDINTIIEDNNMTVLLGGRLDTVSSPDFEKVIDDMDMDIENLVMDFKDLEYTSSAGLRILLKAQKKMNERNGSMKLINVNNDIKEILDMTGFGELLIIE